MWLHNVLSNVNPVLAVKVFFVVVVTYLSCGGEEAVEIDRYLFTRAACRPMPIILETGERRKDFKYIFCSSRDAATEDNADVLPV